MNSAIVTEKLSRSFRWTHALRELDLSVEQGAIYAMVGPNGAGKTTLIKTLMNIVPPSSGRAEVMGRNSRQLRGASFAEIGYVSENQLMPERMLLRDFVDYLRPFYPCWDRQLEHSLMKQFNLPLDRRIRHLSRGMRMKAALASSLAYHPRLIVLDEPFSGLDPLVRDELIAALLERAPEATIFISSHDLAEIESFASHIGYLDGGRLRFSEDINNLSGRFREVELTFDQPPTIPANLPASWMQLNAAGAVVRFVESQFNDERTTAEIRNALGDFKESSFNPMSLRAIFLAMARTKAQGATA